MNKKIGVDEASRILADVRAEQSFWVNDGPIIRNIHEMVGVLANLNEGTFRHHVNQDKNDIANWVRDVLGDEMLANSLIKIKSKEKILKAMRERVKYLEKSIDHANKMI
jgi:hypothetical protein